MRTILFFIATLLYNATGLALNKNTRFTQSSVVLLPSRSRYYFVVGDRLLPLARREEEEIEANGDVLFYYDESGEADIASIPESEEVIDLSDDCLVTQRQVSDRTINPHSEDSEDVFLIPSKLLQTLFYSQKGTSLTI